MGLNQEVLQAIEQLKKGEQEGFNTLYSNTYNYVYSRAKYSINDEQEVFDLMQEVYVSVYKNISSLKDAESLYAWIGSITVRQGAKMANKRKHQVLVSEENETMFEQVPDEELIEEQLANEQDAEAIKECIAGLSEEQRIAVMAYYYDGLKVEEIAELSGVSVGTIKSRLYTARKYLKESITELEKKQGYTLHSFSAPTIILAIKLLLDGSQMPGEKAQAVYNSICAQVGIQAGELALGGTATVQGVKTVGIISKVVGLGKVKIIAIIVGTVLIGGGVGGAVYYNSLANDKAIEASVEKETEKKVAPPEIKVYGEKFIVGINAELDIQGKVVKSITTEDELAKVTIEAQNEAQKKDVVIGASKNSAEKNGVPGRTIKFTKEGTYVITVTAVDTKGGKTSMNLTFEVGNELISYVKGIKDWTVEVNAKDVDFMKGVTFDKEHVKEVKADASKVDLTKEGKYDLTYTIVGIVNNETATVKKTVEVKVLSAKEAKKEADKGNKVVTSNNEVKKDSTGKTPTGETSSNNSSNATVTPSKPNNSSNNNNNNNSNNNSNNNKPNNNGGNSNNNNNGGGNNKPDNKPDNNSKPDPKPDKHEHNWQPVTSVVNHPAEYTTIHHDAVYEDKWVEDSPAWDEPVYEDRVNYVCNNCGWSTTSYDDIHAHGKAHALAGEPSGYSDIPTQVQTGTIHHEATGHTESVLVKEAWDEQKLVKEAYDETVVTGYKCSCGATK